MTLKPSIILAAVFFALGTGFGWILWHPRAAVVETPAFAVRQRDSSLVLARAPDAKAKPPAIIPKGDKIDRIIGATVQPRTVPIEDVRFVHDTVRDTVKIGDSVPRGTITLHPGDSVVCPPVRISLAIVKEKGGGSRVVASSPDGKVIDGLDVPVATAAPVRVLRWSAGALYGPKGNGWGAYVARDLGPLRLTAGGLQGSAKTGTIVMAGVGLRF